MNARTFCRRMREEIAENSVGREDSAAFLIWYLENYFRLETVDAISSVCDQANDRGIDAIYVDDDDETIYIFQSKFSPLDNQNQGDRDLRNFVGTLQWFNNQESVRELLAGTTSNDLISIVNNQKIIEKVYYEKKLIFVTNKTFNDHATEYINVTENLEAYDFQHLFEKYTYFADEEIDLPEVELTISNLTNIAYDLTGGTRARVYAIRARELLKLQGIQDRTLFYKNVRYSVGKTRVNKDIKKTIEEGNEHENFFLYHNGVSIICRELTEDHPNHRIRLRGYAVVNGCQSMLTFYENRDKLSNNLYVLVKIININLTSPLIKKITHNANNQNSISIRDLRSNDSVQTALQREFQEIFGERIFYNRKRGELSPNADIVINKDFAAQIITAVFLGEPHMTHLKQKLFGEYYSKIFSRNMTAEKIFLAKKFYDIVNENTDLLENERIRNYGLALFFFSHVLSEILNMDETGAEILNNPRPYVVDQIIPLTNSIRQIWRLITPDINVDIEEYTEENDNYFDYKNVFKNANFVRNMTRKIKADYQRIVRRNADDSFSRIFETFSTAE